MEQRDLLATSLPNSVSFALRYDLTRRRYFRAHKEAIRLQEDMDETASRRAKTLTRQMLQHMHTAHLPLSADALAECCTTSLEIPTNRQEAKGPQAEADLQKVVAMDQTYLCSIQIGPKRRDKLSSHSAIDFTGQSFLVLLPANAHNDRRRGCYNCDVLYLRKCARGTLTARRVLRTNVNTTSSSQKRRLLQATGPILLLQHLLLASRPIPSSTAPNTTTWHLVREVNVLEGEHAATINTDIKHTAIPSTASLGDC